MGLIVSHLSDEALVDGDEVLRAADRSEGDRHAIDLRIARLWAVGAEPGKLPPAGRIGEIGRKRAVTNVIRLERNGDIEPQPIEGTIASVGSVESGMDSEIAVEGGRFDSG